MALRNGLLIHGPTHWAAAVRDRDGEIQVVSERKPELAPKLAARVPGVRGPLKLAEAMAVLPLVRRRLPAARLPFEDWRVVAAVGTTLVASAALRKRMASSALREGFVQAIGAVPAVVALMDRDLAAYHGVEHKAIAAYEQGVDDPATVPKEHDRCGSNLIAPMMLLSAGGTVLMERLVEHPGPLARAGVGLGGASIAVEMFAWSDRHHDAALARAFHAPGHEIQRLLATKEPTPEQLEVGVAALAEILRAEHAGGAGDQPPPAA
jgi:Predicted metal-dependent enzyme